ncbi:MAG: glycosyltransferase family 25 protein [Alphaproteobacteria bacterium]|nr:glycosyltransferase family 25 protein [Alphaproteobacteria bacterium]
MKAYVINLARDTGRLNHMSARFHELGLDFERVDAVDARLMSAEQIVAFRESRPLHGLWTPGQVGCFLSHFGVWRKIATGTEPYAAVFEDDMHFSPSLKEVFADESWLPPDFDLVRLENSTNRLLLGRRPVVSVAGRALYRLSSTSWCAGAYIMSRDAARRVVAAPEKLHCAADAFLFAHERSPIARELATYQFVPAFATQDKYIGDASKRLCFASNIDMPVQSGGAWERLRGLAGKITVATLLRSIRGYRYIPFEE